MLKTILILVVVAIAAVLIYAATRPDSFRVERSVGIAAQGTTTPVSWATLAES